MLLCVCGSARETPPLPFSARLPVTSPTHQRDLSDRRCTHRTFATLTCRTRHTSPAHRHIRFRRRRDRGATAYTETCGQMSKQFRFVERQRWRQISKLFGTVQDNLGTSLIEPEVNISSAQLSKQPVQRHAGAPATPKMVAASSQTLRVNFCPVRVTISLFWPPAILLTSSMYWSA